MTTKYIDVDSTHRDRTLWPKPGHFQLVVSPASRGTNAYSLAAVDAVSESMPTATWTSNEFVNGTPGTSAISGVVAATGGIGNATGGNVIVVTAVGLQPTTDYYANAQITVPSSNALQNTPVSIRVVSYTYLGNNTGQFIVAPAAQVQPGGAVTVSDPTSVANNAFFVPAGGSIANYRVGDYLYDLTTNEYSRITSYDPATGIAYVAGPTVGWSATDSFEIVGAPPAAVGTTGVASTSTSIVLGAAVAQLSAAQIVGSYVRLLPGGQTARVVAYDATTMTATVSPAFVVGTSAVAFQLLAFSYDNFYPMTYVGTRQYEILTYAVTLKCLTLPSSTLLNGGTALAYPFVYVEFSPLNADVTNVWNSNNPHASRTLFRASYVNYDRSASQPQSPFLHFVGNDMRQRVRFAAESSFNFRVTIPSTGQTFQTVVGDTTSPTPPDPLAQITALFELVREPYDDLAKRLA